MSKNSGKFAHFGVKEYEQAGFAPRGSPENDGPNHLPKAIR
jgi:hypothetical protein